MTNSTAFLDGDADEVGERLLLLARRDRAPQGARERALASVTAVSLGAVVASSTKAALAAPSLASGGGVVAAKWLIIGLGGALVSLTAVDQAQRAFTPPAAPSAATHASVPAVAVPVAAAPSALLPTPEVPEMLAPVSAGAAARPQASALSAPEPAGASPLAPSAADFAAPSVAASLAREVAALRQARAALADAKPGRALEILAAHRRESPVGVLGVEEAALRVELAFALGEPRAPEQARRFLAEHPASPLAARVQSVLEAKSAPGGKP